MTRRLQKAVYFFFGLALFLQSVGALYGATSNTAQYQHTKSTPVYLTSLTLKLLGDDWKETESEGTSDMLLSLPSVNQETESGYISDYGGNTDHGASEYEVKSDDVLVGQSSASGDIYVQSPVYLNRPVWYASWEKQAKIRGAVKTKPYKALSFNLIIDQAAYLVTLKFKDKTSPKLQ